MASDKNAWRRKTDGPVAWGDRLRTGATDKYFVVTADSHANEPLDFLSSRITDPKYVDRLPRVQVEEDGTQRLITDGWEPQLVRVPSDRTDLLPVMEEFENYEVLSPFSDKMEEEDLMRASAGRSVEQRLKHAEIDGIDAEIIFPQKGLLAFATPDPELAHAMCHAWNEWAFETFGDHFDHMLPMALISAGNVETAIKEVQWAAEKGFHGLQFSSRPIFHRANQPKHRLNYNDKAFEPLWAAIQETGLPITFHVATGEDPRAVSGNGAAIVAYQASQTSAVEPLIFLISSGVFERFPALKAGTIEANIGWIPWVLDALDHAYRAHHMWVRPVIPQLPSDYFRRNCFASALEDKRMMKVVMDMGLEDNILWSNDYPHHEGSFPHSALSIERQMAELTEEQRAKVLGLNAARIFNIPIK